MRTFMALLLLLPSWRPLVGQTVVAVTGTRFFVRSQHGLLGLSEGSWNPTGDTLVVKDSALVRGAWIRQRYLLSRPRAGAFTAEGRRSEDGGKTWFLTYRARYSSRPR